MVAPVVYRHGTIIAVMSLARWHCERRSQRPADSSGAGIAGGVGIIAEPWLRNDSIPDEVHRVVCAAIAKARGEG